MAEQLNDKAQRKGNVQRGRLPALDLIKGRWVVWLRGRLVGKNEKNQVRESLQDGWLEK